MVEAKRRKKLLGKDYGQKPPVLVEGSPLFERHLQKFSDAWTEKLEAMVEPDELEESEQKFKEEEFNQWMREYLESYRQNEREKLVKGLLDPLYAELAEIPESETEAIEFALSWSIETIVLYKMFKPYLSNSAASEYAKPLLGFYEMVIREAIENSKDKIEAKEEIEKLKQQFEEILDIEESKRI